MNLETRKQLVEAKVLSIPSYGLGLFMGQSESIKDKITAIFMRAYRVIYGRPLPFKMKNEYICKQIGKKSPRQLMIQEGLKFISKVINTQMPKQIYNLLKFPRKPRKNMKIETKRTPRAIKCRRTLIYKALRQFNALHSSIKFLHPRLFKRAIEKRRILEIPDD